MPSVHVTIRVQSTHKTALDIHLNVNSLTNVITIADQNAVLTDFVIHFPLHYHAYVTKVIL